MQRMKVLLIAGITFLLAGCKLAVIVVEGGEVQSISSGTCTAGTICTVQVDDTNFSEEFTAVPNNGWYFEKWNRGDRLLCGGSYKRTCSLSFQQYSDEQRSVIQELLLSFGTFYLMPVFKEGVRSVEIDGKEWLQPIDFLDYSYDEIAAVCSVESGLCSGSLPESSIDLTGYYWASISDIKELFIAYGAEPLFDDPNSPSDSVEAAKDFCGDFIPYIYGKTKGYVDGYLRDPPSDPDGDGADGYHSAEVLCDGTFLIASALPGSSFFNAGAWFWRTAD